MKWDVVNECASRVWNTIQHSWTLTSNKFSTVHTIQNVAWFLQLLISGSASRILFPKSGAIDSPLIKWLTITATKISTWVWTTCSEWNGEWQTSKRPINEPKCQNETRRKINWYWEAKIVNNISWLPTQLILLTHKNTHAHQVSFLQAYPQKTANINVKNFTV